MTAPLMIVLVFYSLGMACGQVLFKLAAARSSELDMARGPWGFANIYLISGVALYAALTLLWVWILKSVPLSKAYPFSALAFVFTPILSRLFFGELLNFTYFCGMGLLAAGVIVIARA
jgi:drug/metabolite transporter (DMT)-like permease